LLSNNRQKLISGKKIPASVPFIPEPGSKKLIKIFRKAYVSKQEREGFFRRLSTGL